MTKKRTTTKRDASEILDTLRITKIKPRKSCGGSRASAARMLGSYGAGRIIPNSGRMPGLL